ncbi:PE-PGRS family protein [Streptomyces sp. NPDC046805]|uniref:WXG100-like domain-containing protein n=1 Tax=Streptomyces sp. NPDC046805 TaxID=3155134 RepID=UPI0033D2CA1D
MALTLPSELVWVLDLLGYSWPEADEEALHEVAEAWRSFGTELEQIQVRGEGLAGIVVSSNAGSAVDGFSKAWSAYTGANGQDSYLPDAQTACEVIALAFDGAAVAVLTAKLAVIAQLVALALEIIAAQASAPFTFGLSEIGGLGATQATRLIVRELLDKLKREVMEAITKAMEHASMDALKKIAKEQLEKVTKEAVKEQAKKFAKEKAKEIVQEKVVDAAKDKAREAAVGMVQNVGQQGIETYFDARSGIDLGETADVGKKAAGEYVDGLKNEVTGGEGSALADYADPNTYVDSATEAASGAVEDRAQRGVDALSGQGGGDTTGASDSSDSSNAASSNTSGSSGSSGSSHAATGRRNRGTSGGMDEWARNEFG